MKRHLILFVTLLLSLSMFIAACDEIPSGSGSSGGSGSSSDDDIISAVVEDAPDYVVPTMYNLSSSYVMPTLTDDEMKEVVFTLSEKHYFDTEPIPDIADRGHEYGRVYLYEQSGLNAEPSDYYYIIDGITTDMETSDEYNKYKIRYNNVYVANFPGQWYAPVNNSYWQQYFDVMFDNVVFSEAELTEDTINKELDSFDADVWTWVIGDGATYYFYADGTLRKVSDNVLYVADRKVDSPKVFMLSVIFHLFLNDSDNGINGLNYTDDVTFYYRGKTAKVAFKEIPKLLLGDNRNVQFVNYPDIDQCSFDIEWYYNEACSIGDDLVYTVNKYGENYAIDSEGNVYRVRYYEGNDLDNTDHHILGYYLSAVCKQCAVYDYERLIGLFK